MTESDETLQAPDPEVDEGETDDEDETVEAERLECIVQAGPLRQTVDALLSIADEAKFYLGSHGLQVRLCDPGNISMGEVELDAAGFESTGEGSYVVGLNLERFDEVTSKADDDDLIHLSFREDNRKLNIQYGRVDVDLAAIDPDSIRREPDFPDLDLPNRAELPRDVLREGIQVADMVSDHIWISTDLDAEEIVLHAEGDTDDVRWTPDADDYEFADVRDDTDVCLSLGYLKDMTKPIPSDAVVEVVFGEEWPIRLLWSYADGHGEVEQFLAPRITNK